MSSLIRRLQLRIMKRGGYARETPQQFKMLPDGGYKVYHPTKGWRRVSPKRLKYFPGLGA